MNKSPFAFAGRQAALPAREAAGKSSRRPAGRTRFPLLWGAALLAVLLPCLFAGAVSNHDPAYLELAHISEPPGAEFYFGTDPLGRDVFSMIWHGGRLSLLVGFTAALIAAGIAVLYGSVSGTAPAAVDAVLMRLVEAASSVPSILVVIFLQAVVGRTTPFSIAAVIGVTSWMSMAKVVRSEVRQLRDSDYILAARMFGGGFFYRLRRHLLPNVFPAILFMAVTNVSSAIAAESTLSFLGIGLPVGTVSWGSMLSQADRALLSGSWWVIIIPGLFLVVTLVSITELGNYLRKNNLKACSNL